MENGIIIKKIQEQIKNIKTFFYLMVSSQFKKKETKNNMAEEKDRFIKKFEDYVDKHNEKPSDIWKGIDEISEITGTTISNVNKYLYNFDEFLRNSQGKYTTKREYETKTRLSKKIIDLLNGKIK